jgi:pimeloyl-ACP methyl ester carboxylesterase
MKRASSLRSWCCLWPKNSAELMRRPRRALTALGVGALFAMLAGCASLNGTAERTEDGGCKAADHLEYVSGGGECLAIKTFSIPSAQNPEVLVVSIHGDKTNGLPIGWEYRSAEKFAGEQVISVSMLRPGYNDKFGKVSSGDLNGRVDNYTAHNIDAIADAIRNLKRYHKTPKVVLAGYSGGANITGVILGRHPDIASGAVLLACACDLSRYRAGRSPWFRSLSAQQFADGVPLTSRVIAVTGNRDTNTPAFLAQAYVARLKERGVLAEFRFAEGITHDNALDAPAYLDAVADVVRDVMR